MGYDTEVANSIYEKRLDIRNIRRIMTYGRTATSEMEKFWVNKYLFTPEMIAAGMYKDGFHYPRQAGEGEGNVIIEIGNGSKTLFSSHTDTVHRTGVVQNVIINPEESILKFTTDSGQCLGGDDGTGVWLMLELIKAGVPGLYIFHRAEEVGGQGSSYIANSTPQLIMGYDRGVAFDRKDDWSIITHQAGTRTCSDEFAEDLAKQLGMSHKADKTGSFTDTANYDTIIPECTNLSVGYHNAHSARENQEIEYLLEFRDALIKVDWESLVTERDPSVQEYSTYGYYGYGDRLVKPKKSVRQAVGWGDWEDQQFERRKNKLAEEKEKTDTSDKKPELESVIFVDELEGADEEDVLAFLDKKISEMTEEEFQFFEMIENGIILEDELRQMMTGNVEEGDFIIEEQEIDEDPFDYDSFFDDGFDDEDEDDVSSKYPPDLKEKDQADYDDEDYDFKEWYTGQ